MGLVNSSCSQNHPYASFILAISELMSRSWLVRVTHILRKGKRVADFLANYGHAMPLGLHCLDNPPNGCFVLLGHDSIGVYFRRKVAA